MLKREDWSVGRNLVYRLYREEGLTLRTKRPRRRKMVVHLEARCQPKQVVDILTREGLAIEVGHRLRGEDVVEVLKRLVRRRGASKYLFADNGAKLTG